MFDLQTLLRARAHLTIIHHVPGRIRLRFGPGILAAIPDVTAAADKKDLPRIDGIRDISLNLPALSIVVEYDPTLLEPASWEKLIDGSDQDAEAVVASLSPSAKPQ